MLNISLLRNIGIVDNSGKVTDYPQLSPNQSATVIRELLKVLNSNYNEKEGEDITDKVQSNIASYLDKTNCAGRSIYNGFPQFIVRDIIANHGPKLIDHLLLYDD